MVGQFPQSPTVHGLFRQGAYLRWPEAFGFCSNLVGVFFPLHPVCLTEEDGKRLVGDEFCMGSLRLQPFEER
jgi:hypothetical protein